MTTTSGAAAVAWLIPGLPLAGFVLLLAAGRRLREPVAGWVGTLAAAGSFGVSVAVFLQLLALPAGQRELVTELFTWIAVGPLEVRTDLLLDPLSGVMILVVTGVGSLIHLYSIGYMHGDERYSRYFAYLNLFLFSMLVLVLASDFLVLFVGWELVGLCSYLLIGFWFERADYASAAKKAFVVNRVGDVSFMIGMFLIFATFGSLSYFDVLPAAGTVGGATALAIGLLLFGGATGKSAQIPLYVWLPDAMAGPTPVSALIHAATMVTAGVYLVARTSALYLQSVTAMEVIAWIGVATALLAALIALRQDDIKKILAYSTVSQLGFMFVGVGVGAFAVGVFHLVTHAFFKGLLFLAAGSVMHALANETDVWKMGGLRRYLPVTFWTSAVAWLAISGIPPFAGFFSKDQILEEAYATGHTAIWAIGLLTAGLTALYMTRWFVLIFLGRERVAASSAEMAEAGPSPSEEEVAHLGDPHLGPPSGGEPVPHVREPHPHESPPLMTVPLVVLAVLSLVGGFLLNPTAHGPLARWLEPAVGSGPAHLPGLALSEPVLIALSVVVAAAGIALGFALYLKGEVRERITGPIATVLEHRFYVDDLYGLVFVRGGQQLARALAWVDRNVVDGAVNGVGALMTVSGSGLRRVQTGFVRGYVAAVALGTIALVAAFLVQVR